MIVARRREKSSIKRMIQVNKDRTKSLMRTAHRHGWDGCRDLEWNFTPLWAILASVYIEKFNMLVMHGGMGYHRPGGGPHLSNAPAPPCILGLLGKAQGLG
jgi:hypothetical protein